MLIRIVIADDHDLLRHGLATFIETHADFQLLGEATNGIEAVKLCTQYQPDVVIMDMLMPEMDGITAIKMIRQCSPNTKIIALTGYEDDALVQSAIQAGAISYLMKNVSTDALETAIRKTWSGQSTLAPEAVHALLHIPNNDFTPNFLLTDREYEVLVLMVEGLTNAEIAAELVITISTVKKHVRNILTKMNTRNRTEATALALQHKLIVRIAKD